MHKEGKKEEEEEKGGGIGKGRNLSEAGGTKRNNLLSSRPKEGTLDKGFPIWIGLNIW